MYIRGKENGNTQGDLPIQPTAVVHITGTQQFLVPWFPLSNLPLEKQVIFTSAPKLKPKTIFILKHLFSKCSHTGNLSMRKGRIVGSLVAIENYFIIHSEWSYLLYAAAPCIKSKKHYIWWRKWEILRVVRTLNFHHKENLYKAI